MREDVANIDHLPAVLDHGDEPVFVAADIEYGKKLHRIGVPEISAHVHQTLPPGALGDQVPMHQGLQGVLVISYELDNGRLADDPHTRKVTKTVTEGQGEEGASSLLTPKSALKICARGSGSGHPASVPPILRASRHGAYRAVSSPRSPIQLRPELHAAGELDGGILFQLRQHALRHQAIGGHQRYRLRRAFAASQGEVRDVD